MKQKNSKRHLKSLSLSICIILSFLLLAEFSGIGNLKNLHFSEVNIPVTGNTLTKVNTTNEKATNTKRAATTATKTIKTKATKTIKTKATKTIKTKTTKTIKTKTTTVKTKATTTKTDKYKNTKTQAGKAVDNYISIPSVKIKANTYTINNKTKNSQGAVDEYDVCIDTNRGNEDVILLYGHNYKSFKKLNDIKVGDNIYLTINGKMTKHKVYYSDYGYLTKNKRNILDRHNSKPLLKYSSAYCKYTKQECYVATEPVLQMYTCYEDARWVVLAKPY